MAMLLYVSAVLVMICTTSTWGAGDCDKSKFGHDESWQRRNAEGLAIDIRGCIDKTGMTHLDIRNPYEFDVCVSVHANTSGDQWQLLMSPGMVITKSVHLSNETWQIKAERETGKICPNPEKKPVHKKYRRKTKKKQETPQ